jgi:hypothetical protein
MLLALASNFSTTKDSKAVVNRREKIDWNLVLERVFSV